MNKFLFLTFLLLLSSCYKFKETNSFAIPPIARDELKTTNKTK